MTSLSRSTLLLEEFMHRFHAKAVIDLSCMDGTWAAAAMNRGVPYVGFCNNISHVCSSAFAKYSCMQMQSKCESHCFVVILCYFLIFNSKGQGGP